MNRSGYRRGYGTLILPHIGDSTCWALGWGVNDHSKMNSPDKNTELRQSKVKTYDYMDCRPCYRKITNSRDHP